MATNGTLPHDTEAALVVWVSRAFPESPNASNRMLMFLQANSFALSDPVQSLEEMNDGKVLWEMLRKSKSMQGTEGHADLSLGEIKPETFSQELPSKKQSEYAREQNCQFSPPYLLLTRTRLISSSAIHLYGSNVISG